MTGASELRLVPEGCPVSGQLRRDHGEVMAAVSNLNEASANIGGDIVTSPMKENNYLSCTVFRMSALLG